MNIGWNGAVKPAEEAVISVYDHGFLYGMGLFETFRTYEGRPFLLERHLDRLHEGCRSLGIGYRADADAIRAWLRDLMRANGLAEAYVRLTVTAGVGGLGLPLEDYTKPDSLLLVKPLPPADPLLYRRGKELALLQTRRNTPEGDIRLKSLHYMNNIIAKRELLGMQAAPGAEGLMLTSEGWLAEGIVSNLFFARNGIIFTPSIETGILPGITRQRVMELAQAGGLKIVEGLFEWEQLLEADEVWVTNSIQELVPVTSLRDGQGTVHCVGNAGAGPVQQQLLEAYRQEAASVLE
ncbi:aminodeoxychorismate lyase [Paenibacillus nasutitermitis]|uniref:aminodeoxychorismate lyase n=1 Tax=Paenibacillus nasutitermitis TaxID=1652958 RepID=A0A916ZJN8_9BACL|nr:aminodeoxychorismate lyase [Paenibacillus nasutitermitis]GGD99784.1 4-amino-4-deoxychorismate lyase [Paenibacillus nasutitermitis]